MSSKGMQHQQTSGMSVTESKKKGQTQEKQEQQISDQVPQSSSNSNDNIINQNEGSNDQGAHSTTNPNNTKRQTRSQALQQQQQHTISSINNSFAGLKQEGTEPDQKDPSEKGFELHRVTTTDDDQDQNYQFYKEYCRLYYANIVLTNRLQHLLNEKQELQFKLNRLESNKRKHEEALGMTFDIAEEKRKRHRRTATEIARHYRCPIEDCPKSYGSEGSLNQHLKLKHLEFYQQLCQTNQINPVTGMPKHDASLNDGKSAYSNSYDDKGNMSDRDDGDEDSYGEEEEEQQQIKTKDNKTNQQFKQNQDNIDIKQAANNDDLN